MPDEEKTWVLCPGCARERLAAPADGCTNAQHRRTYERLHASELAEPDSEEALRALVEELYLGTGVKQNIRGAALSRLRNFAREVREHERLALRERPTQPDLKVLKEPR
jgi:hypothetical protein